MLPTHKELQMYWFPQLWPEHHRHHHHHHHLPPPHLHYSTIQSTISNYGNTIKPSLKNNSVTTTEIINWMLQCTLWSICTSHVRYRGYYTPVHAYEFYFGVFNSTSRELAEWTSEILIWPQTFCLNINSNIEEIIVIYRRFPNISKDFQRFLKILWRPSKVDTNISDHFPKISEDVRRLPKVAKYFWAIFEDVSIV